MKLKVSCKLKFEIEKPTPFIFMLRPRSGAHQWIEKEVYKLTPIVPVHQFTDNFGNLCQRLIAQPGNFSVSTATEVITSGLSDVGTNKPFVRIQDLPDHVLSYLLPSRYCESDRFNDMAFEITEGELLGYNQVAAITDWIRKNIEYKPGAVFQPLSAIQVNEQGYGICRDMAHLGITMCRSLSIPARIVVGYLDKLAPMDMHAWFEAFVGGRWYTFDATQPTNKGVYVVLGYGRDAGDVAIFNQFGPSVFPLSQTVKVEQLLS